MFALFIFWRVTERTKRKQRERFYKSVNEKLDARLARQSKPNVAPFVEVGDTVKYEFTDRRGELRQIRVVKEPIMDNFYIGNWFLGHVKGEIFVVPVSHGYRELTILAINKGESTAFEARA
jgi:hypothetical protein